MISTTPEQLERLLNRLENYNLEFKKASNNFDSRELRDYCAALANEHGGKLLLGVQQKQDKTGEVTGTTAFESTYNTLSHDLLRELNIRVDVEEVFYSGKRVLFFHVPSRPVGSFIRSSGRYKNPMRAGESLCEMDDQTIRAIMNEREPDLSAETVPGLTLGDLDTNAISRFKTLWSKNAGRADYLQYSDDKLLDSAELITEKGITLAAVLLFGKSGKISEYLPGAEIIRGAYPVERHTSGSSKTVNCRASCPKQNRNSKRFRRYFSSFEPPCHKWFAQRPEKGR